MQRRIFLQKEEEEEQKKVINYNKIAKNANLKQKYFNFVGQQLWKKKDFDINSLSSEFQQKLLNVFIINKIN